MVVCCSAFFSARMNIQMIGNREKTNQKTRPTSAASAPMDQRFWPGRSSLREVLSAMAYDSAPAARRCAFPSTLTR